MSTYTDQVMSALTAFDATLATFGALVRTRPSSATVLRKDLDRLADWANRAGAASSRLRFSSNIIVDTAVDIVDFQVRLQGEAAALASALGGLAGVLEKQTAIRDAFEDAVVGLDETAQTLASALFPGAVEGLGDVNVALWDFDRVLWREYTTKFRDAVREGHLTFDQQSRIQAIANEVHQAFDDVNALLNALAENAIPDGPSITRALTAARTALLKAVDTAAKKLTKPYADFAPFVERAGKIARRVDRLLDKLRIPVFPAHADLADLRPCISPGLYASLGGAQRFALLNIASRLQAITVNGRGLLDPAYDVRIHRVFPDRLYLNADAALIADIAADAMQFGQAPAGLHRYRDGSFKGRHSRKGNLQVSFARDISGARVDVDVDIDLYRDPFRHLFGEVLVNHLTGHTTDQFEVQAILAEQQINPIGGFTLLAA
jgi:hypothetical protein